LGYEAGKGRELELERKIAARAAEEAIAGQRLEQPAVRSSLERICLRPEREAGAPEAGAYHEAETGGSTMAGRAAKDR
jgi:hypothetical protein